MNKWIASELHCHTYHSDGRQTLLEIATEGKKLGLSVIASTDHNTVSANKEIYEVYEKTGVMIIKGIEYTTFYGHILNLNAKECLDWKNLHKNNLNPFLDKLHENGGIAGIAHPFRIGTPICTGCHFEYNVDYNKVDYIEIWSREFPSVKSYENEPCFPFWNELLNEGYKIRGVCGRDWHGSKNMHNYPISRTFLNLSEPATLENIDVLATKAITSGDCSVSMAHCIILTKNNNRTVTVSIDGLGLNYLWAMYSINNLTIKLFSENAYLLEKKIIEGDKITYNVPENISWIRADLFGNIVDDYTIIGFSNPVFFEN